MKHRLPALALFLLSAVISARAEDLDASARKSSVFFDGAGSYAAATTQAPSQRNKAWLLAELKKRVTINDRGAPGERASLNAILSNLLDSSVARELADEFIKEDAKATLAFEEIPNTVIFETNGRKEFRASGGYTSVNKAPPDVRLNRAYLEADRFGCKPEETLAHELFGHALERKRAERYGVADGYLYFQHQNEEANAGLIGWTVTAELGNKISNPWAWIYMENPDDYHDQLKSNLPYYAGTLSAEEMKNPLAVYKGRLANIKKLLLRLPAGKKKDETWLKRIDHLITRHQMDPSSFLTIKEDISATLAMMPGRKANLLGIKRYLENLIAECGGEKGAAWTAKLAASSDNPYFKEKELEMERRRQILAGLMLGKNQESESPPERPGQISWDRLRELWEQDIKTGCGKL